MLNSVKLFILILIALPVFGQVAGGTITGEITDNSGAVMPHAAVTVKNTATDVGRAIATNESGVYSAPNLLPGNYEVTVSAPGFETLVRSGLTLAVGGELVVNIELRVGNTGERIEVVGEAPTVDLASSSLNASVSGTAVRELPLNGRSWTDLASLEPGVAPIETQIAYNLGAGRGNRGFGAQLSISGARPQQNNYRLDGLSLNDYANGGPGSVLGGNLGVDAVQEFSVLTSNYSAEYGKTSGGVVNATTRSGTNQFHGSVYEFLRNSALDARNFFDITQSPPPFKRNQFGASAGGPIVKNRTFIFGDYEGIRQSLGTTNLIVVPSAAARVGNLSTGTVAVDPVVQKYLGFYPLPNSGLIGLGDTGRYTFTGQQITKEDFFTIRADHKISDKDNLFGTYMYDNAPFTSPDSFNNVKVGSTTRRQAAVVEETHVFNPTLANSFRFGVNRSLADNNVGLSAINPLAGDLTLGSAPGRYASTITIPGLGRMLGGLGGSPTYFFRFTSFQAYDDAFLTVGHHSLKFGAVVERMRDNLQALSNPNGGFTFNSLGDFLTNKPRGFSSGFANTLTPRGIRQTLAGAYLQDDWRLRPNLTVNLGLRYEVTTVPTEVQGKLSTLINITDAQPHLGDPLFANPTLKNFEPRVGFAWDPFGDGKTSIRSGFGFYDVLPLPYTLEILSSLSAPFFKIGSITKLAPGTFPYGAFSQLGVHTLNQVYIDQHPHRNYVMQWNFNIQRELAKKLTAMASYVGSRGVHQPFRSDDINFVMPTLTPQGYLWPFPVGSGTLLNPNAGEIRAIFWEGNSSYHSLQSQLIRRLSHGFQVQGSYTWSKSIDINSATLVGDAFGNSIPSLHWFDTKLSRGLSDFNVGQTAVINTLWQIPNRSISSRAAWAVNGWELGAIFKANSGVPFTAILGGDPLGLNSTDPYAFPNRLGGPDCASLVNPGNPTNYVKTQCFSFPVPQTLNGNEGRNVLIGPGTSNLDISVFKNNRVPKISESFNAQLRIEIFNILNHANFAPPNIANLNLFDAKGKAIPGAGFLDSTTTPSRQVQFALKVSW
jgi:hypothetical protein